MANLQLGLKSKIIMTKIDDVGLDVGNLRVKICIEVDGKLLFASIPSIYAFDAPIIIGKTGVEIKSKAFSLLFRIQDKNNKSYKDIKLWFGNDVLVSQSTIGKIDAGKYVKSHIQRLFQGVLYQWSQQHEQDLSELGKLNICVSMPAGSYQKAGERKKAENAYIDAFDTGQSHIQLRDGKEIVQIVTQFHSLVREAVVWGNDIPKKNEVILVVDLGGGTDDVVVFLNGSTDSRTYPTGLLHTYQKIDYVNPNKVELKILTNKNYFPDEMLSYYDDKEYLVRITNRVLRRQADKIYLIGGGAALMPKVIKSTFNQLAPEVIIKDQYANCEANWKEARGK